MAKLNFPSDTSQSPYVENGVTYTWDGQKWTASIDGGEIVIVHVGSSPPTPPNNEGDLWWDDEAARMYIYYTDDDSSQWVDASPGGGSGGDEYTLPVASDIRLGGIKVGSRLTIAGDGTLSADIQGGGGTTVGNLQEVTDEGNTTTNGATFGDGNISLNADGTAEFADRIQALYFSGYLGTAGYVYYMGPNSTNAGGLYQQNNAGYLFLRDGDSDVTNIELNGENGEGWFSGDVAIGGVSSTASNISLNEDGSAEFAADVRIGTVQWNTSTGFGIFNKLTSAGYAELQINNNAVQGSNAFGIRSSTYSSSLLAGNVAANISNDGSANFAGGRVKLNDDGSATFGGTVQVGDDNPNRIKLFANGLISTRRDDGGDILNVYKDGLAAGDRTVEISSEGSATFAGFVRTPRVGTSFSSIFFAGSSGIPSALPNNSTYIYNGSSSTDDGTYFANTPFTAVSDLTALMANDGSFRLGGTLPASPNISLNADGTITSLGTAATANIWGTGAYSEVTSLTLGYNRAAIRSELSSTSSNPGADLQFYTRADSTTNDPTVRRMDIDRAGNVLIGGTLPASPNIELNADGSAEFAGNVRLQTDYTLSWGDDNCRIYRATDDFRIDVGGMERARFDSSGRLLVGATSDSANTTLVLQGNAGGSTRTPVIKLQRDATPTGNGDSLGSVIFNNVAGGQGAEIAAFADSAWTNTSSHPARLVFKTTGSGDATATERLHIRNDGALRLLNSPGIDFSGISGTSSDATVLNNVLDDYEEGVSTVTVANLTADTNVVTMRYVKTGGLVTIMGTIQLVNITSALTANANFRIPFTPISFLESVPGAAIQKNTINTDVAYLGTYGGNPQLFFNRTSGSYVAANALTAGLIGFTISYPTND